MQSHEYSSDESQFLISLDKSPKKENDLAESVTKTNSTDRECTAKKQERIILHLQNAENAAPKRQKSHQKAAAMLLRFILFLLDFGLSYGRLECL